MHKIIILCMIVEMRAMFISVESATVPIVNSVRCYTWKINDEDTLIPCDVSIFFPDMIDYCLKGLLITDLELLVDSEHYLSIWIDSDTRLGAVFRCCVMNVLSGVNPGLLRSCSSPLVTPPYATYLWLPFPCEIIMRFFRYLLAVDANALVSKHVTLDHLKLLYADTYPSNMKSAESASMLNSEKQRTSNEES